LWPAFKILKQIVQMDSNLYPELLRQVLLVRAPQKFQDVWKLAETYFEPGTWEKIILVPPAETSNVLRTHIPHEYIPRFLGGPRVSAAPITRKIPRKLLRWFDQQRFTPLVPSNAINSFDEQDLRMTPLMCGFDPSLFMKQTLQNNSRFLEKTVTLPESSWDTNGAVPSAHSWGTLCGSQARDAALLDLLDVDMFKSSEDDPIMHVYNHPFLAPQHFRRQGDDRFFLVINWVTGDHQMTVLAAVPPRRQLMTEPTNSCGDVQIWRRFLEQSCAQKWRRFHIGVNLFEAPWIVHQVIKPHQSSFLAKLQPGHQQGDDYLEITIRLTQSWMRRLCVIFRHSCHLVVFGLTYSLVGDTPEEPPETLLFAHYCSRVNVSSVRKLEAQEFSGGIPGECISYRKP